MPKGIYPRNEDSKIFGSKILTHLQDELISQMYLDGIDIKNLSKNFGVGYQTIRRSLKRTNTPVSKGHKGDKNPSWKGGKIIDKNGYVLIWKPDHPFANCGGYVREHRLVMEQMLGRFLEKSEVVHHKNHCRTDNIPENLILFANNGTHLGVELIGKIPKWTSDGKKKIQSRSIPPMKGIPHSPKGNGVRLLRRKLIHQFQHETSGLDDTLQEALLLQLPSFPKRGKKKKHEKE